jgi:hypothetical protein
MRRRRWPDRAHGGTIIEMRATIAELTLRRARRADSTFIFSLTEQVFSPYSYDPGRSMESMLGEPSAEAWVAEHAGATVGFFVADIERFTRDYGPWKRPALARLNAIAVRPDAQGRAEKNLRARRLFTSAGFQRLFVVADAYARGHRGIGMIKAL